MNWFAQKAWKGSLVMGGAVLLASGPVFAQTMRFAPGSPEAQVLCKKDVASRNDKEFLYMRLKWLRGCNRITDAQLAAFGPDIAAIDNDMVMRSDATLANMPSYNAALSREWSYPLFVMGDGTLPVEQLVVWKPPYFGNFLQSIDEYGELSTTSASCPSAGNVRTMVTTCTNVQVTQPAVFGGMDIGDNIEARCRVEDVIGVQEKARRRSDWALQCGMIFEEEWWNLYYEISGGTRRTLPVGETRYVSFAQYPPSGTNVETWTWPLWKPEETPYNAAGARLPTQLITDKNESGGLVGDVVVLAKNNMGVYPQCDIPAGVSLFGFCPFGCFAPDQELMFESGPMAIESAMKAGKVDLITLAPDATLEQLSFMANTVNRYVADPLPQKQELVSLRMESGGSLRVTPSHPLIVEDGTIRQARDLQVGDQLMRADGTLDAVFELQTSEYYGKVFNVKPVTLDTTTNVLIAQGYLTASQRYQHDGERYLRRAMLRRTLPDWTLPE
ncbi:Hint domain-containing protein [Archangium violaceum]|uniref:Hint domain-containing protein n=1 Tax=Archangium violaceum TaxID=83451 RepID=UPI0036DEDBDC